MSEEVEKLVEALETAQGQSCGCTSLHVFSDAAAAISRMAGDLDEVGLSEAELEQACKDLDLEIEDLRAQVEALREALTDVLGIIHTVCPEYDEATMCANAYALLAGSSAKSSAEAEQ